MLTVRGGGSVTLPPAGAGDDEFNAALSGWSTLASSTGTADANSTVPGALYMAPSGGFPAYGIYKASPATPFTVTARITALVNDASEYSDMGLMLGEATPGKFIHGCLDVAYLGSFNLLGSYWPDPTTWSNNIGDGATVSGVPHYTRFVVNSTTNVDGYYSTNGTSWYQWLTAHDPGFTIGSVGLDIHGAGVSMTVDWIRFT